MKKDGLIENGIVERHVIGNRKTIIGTRNQVGVSPCAILPFVFECFMLLEQTSPISDILSCRVRVPTERLSSLGVAERGTLSLDFPRKNVGKIRGAVESGAIKNANE